MLPRLDQTCACCLPHTPHAVSTMFHAQRSQPRPPLLPQLGARQPFLSPGLAQEPHSPQGDHITLSLQARARDQGHHATLHHRHVTSRHRGLDSAPPPAPLPLPDSQPAAPCLCLHASPYNGDNSIFFIRMLRALNEPET